MKLLPEITATSLEDAKIKAIYEEMCGKLDTKAMLIELAEKIDWHNKYGDAIPHLVWDARP